MRVVFEMCDLNADSKKAALGSFKVVSKNMFTDSHSFKLDEFPDHDVYVNKTWSGCLIKIVRRDT